jgi:hypothetical protein
VAQVKRTGSASLTDALVADEQRLAQARQKRAEIESAVHVEQLDEAGIMNSAKAMRSAFRSKDRSRIKDLLSELVASVDVDWSKRKDPVVSFSYVRNAKPLEAEGAPASQDFVDMLNAAAALVTIDDIAARIMSEMTSPTPGIGGANIRITHSRAPLTFLAKWDLANIERIATDAAERLGRSLQEVS